jgi:hypothetical protein
MLSHSFDLYLALPDMSDHLNDLHLLLQYKQPQRSRAQRLAVPLSAVLQRGQQHCCLYGDLWKRDDAQRNC